VLRRLPNRSDVIFRVEPILRTKLPVEEIKALRDRLVAAGRSSSEENAQTSDQTTEAATDGK